MKNKIVTPEIDAYLKEHYADARNYVLAEKLNISEVWIRQRAKFLKLKKNAGLGYRPRKETHPAEYEAITRQGNRTIHRCI